MNSIDKALKNIMGKKKSNFGFGSIKPLKPISNFGLKPFGGKNDWDFDGVPNRMDCQPRNTMRQDKKIKLIKLKGDYDSGELYTTNIIKNARMTGKFDNTIYDNNNKEYGSPESLTIIHKGKKYFNIPVWNTGEEDDEDFQYDWVILEDLK